MTEHEFRALYLELVDENPFAVRAVLKILDLEFTREVPTAAVTCTDPPILKVNLEFVSAHCRTPEHVKALVVHEFLHVLLRHTGSLRALTPERHLATDAVINALIHRTLGPAYSDLMACYYAQETGVRKLLRPCSAQEWMDIWLRRRSNKANPLEEAWVGLYDGRLCADDIEEIARDLPRERAPLDARLLGGHAAGDALSGGSSGEPGDGLPGELGEALDRSLKSMNGDGIWRSPHGRGVGADAYGASFRESTGEVDAWCRSTYAILKRHVDPSTNGALTESRPIDYMLPVLSSADRRAVLRSLWSPFLPDARWSSERAERVGGTQVYLDVSGSMNAEMPLLVKLLGRLSRYLQRPFWAFSNRVAPAVIENGMLRVDTTGGTSMACVLRHVAEQRPPAAVVVTDGYIETLPKKLVGTIGSTRLHAIVTRDGSPRALARAGVPYTQLARLPR